jgi:hypothetical protein
MKRMNGIPEGQIPRPRRDLSYQLNQKEFFRPKLQVIQQGVLNIGEELAMGSHQPFRIGQLGGYSIDK